MLKVGVDWGSSAFRAYRFDEHGRVVDTVEDGTGIKFVEVGEFESVLFDHIGAWLGDGDAVILSGMITSRNGWVESPYVSCPTDLSRLWERAERRRFRGIDLWFLPGVSQQQPPDVMRGEELQLLGTESDTDVSIAVMPGTHSKWVRLNGSNLVQFHTIATGEIFEVLLKHTLIGNLHTTKDWVADAFTRGVDIGFNSSGIIADLFSVRASALLSQQPASSLYSYLSGLLIGNEIKEGVNLIANELQPITLIGSPSLCQRYLDSFSQLGISATVAPSDVTARGFARLASALKSKSK